MIKTDTKSNAQSWELEVTCKNKEYLDAVVIAALKYGMIDIEVECIDFINGGDKPDGRYLVLLSCSWFNNLRDISNDLYEIEKKLDKIE